MCENSVEVRCNDCIADINAFAFSPLNLSKPLIFRIVKYAKVTEVNRQSVNFKENQPKQVR